MQFEVFISSHFILEEALQEERGFPYFTAHSEEHTRLTKRFSEWVDLLDSTNDLERFPSLAKNFTCEVESENLPFLPSSRLVLGGEDFGKKSLYLVDFTEKITEIDGCIGMDFLKQHVLYLDFKNNLAYIDKKK